MRNYPATLFEELRKTMYLSTGGVLTEIKTGNSPDTSYKLYCLGRRCVIPKLMCISLVNVLFCHRISAETICFCSRIVTPVPVAARSKA